MPKKLSTEHNELSPTSSLVLFLAGKQSYLQKNTQKYLEYINFDKEAVYIKEFIKIWPPMDNVIKNRKYAIKKMAFDFLNKNNNAQVIILAAGLDPLSIEIASVYPKSCIFEIDKYNMDVKTQLLKKVGNLEAIKCITADLTDIKSVEKNLLKVLWNKKKPTLLIAEGISYYISEKSLWSIVNIFKSPNKNNELILEYLLPYNLVNEKYRDIAKKTFQKLEKDYNLSSIVHYSKELIKRQLPKVSGDLKKTFNFCQIEKERLGKNSFFTDSKDCWIEVSSITI
ncbi:MAG: class I SAM-dependent methyltransferase [Bdellovibrionales bacterium]|nr:class I SAM-dependent methyltransferase [Bdellovibrionales bacterium]